MSKIRFFFLLQVLNRCNVAVIGKLALKSQPNKELVVSTTHLLFNPRRADVRLAQLQVLLAELDRIARDSQAFERMRPIILTGDFNVQQNSDEFCLLMGKQVHPAQLFARMQLRASNRKQLLPVTLGISDSCQHLDVHMNGNLSQTAVRRVLVAQLLRPIVDETSNAQPLFACQLIVQLHRTANAATFAKHVQKRLITDDDVKRSTLPFNTGALQHNLKLAPTLCAGEPYRIDAAHASTYHGKWIMVDYMLYSADQSVHGTPKLTLLANYQLPSIGECVRAGPIPNERLGSDHYSIAARFALN